jgi:hypothetical protein
LSKDKQKKYLCGNLSDIQSWQEGFLEPLTQADRVCVNRNKLCRKLPWLILELHNAATLGNWQYSTKNHIKKIK